MLMPVSDARTAALSVFELLSHHHPLPVQAVLDNVLKTAGLDPRQHGLVTELVYGVLRHEARLDFLLGKFLRDVKKTPPKLRRVLLMALYALQHMDRTPAALTVDAFVKLAKETCGLSLGKVTNGVLRSFLRSEWAELNPKKIEATAGGGLQGLSTACSVPLWMLELWQQNGDPRPYAQAASCSPWPCVRVNAARADAPELREALLTVGEPVGVWGVRFSPREQPENLGELLRDGKVSRQGAGSIQMLDALMPHLHGEIWDGCAGFGGKTCAMLERGLAVRAASDTHRGRLAGLEREVGRLGLPKPALFVASADKPPLSRVDSILLDVPCSGLGTLSRRPDLRRERKPEHLPALMVLQAHMLRAAWPLLSAGGVLAYVTCALNPAENERQVAAFLADVPDAQLVCEHAGIPDGFGSDLLYGAVVRRGR